jgi:hypothetical protein
MNCATGRSYPQHHGSLPGDISDTPLPEASLKRHELAEVGTPEPPSSTYLKGGDRFPDDLLSAYAVVTEQLPSPRAGESH